MNNCSIFVCAMLFAVMKVKVTAKVIKNIKKSLVRRDLNCYNMCDHTCHGNALLRTEVSCGRLMCDL